MKAEVRRCYTTIQRVRTVISTTEVRQQVPHVRDRLVLGRAQPDAKAPSNMRPCLKKMAVSSPSGDGDA